MPETKTAPSKIRALTGRLRIGRTALIIALALALAAGGLAWRFLRAAGDKNSTYTTSQVAYGSIQETIGASGNVMAEQSVTLTFKSQGYVKACYVKLGDQVRAGQTLALEEATDLQSALDQAEASLQSAQASYDKLVTTKPQQIAQLQAQVDSARAAVERDQQLLAIGSISQTTLDADNIAYQTAQYNLAQAQSDADVIASAAQVKNAQAQVATARDNLENAEMTAPFDGYISSISGNAGQWTGSGTSSSTTTQFSIVMTSTQLQIDAQINEADISKVSVGQAVTFTVNTYPGETFTGRITALSPSATAVSNVQMYEALISIDDYSKLKSGLPASITIITASADNVLVIPQIALTYGRTYMASRVSAGSGPNPPAGGSGDSAPSEGSPAAPQDGAGPAQGGDSSARSGDSSAQDSSVVAVLVDGQPQARRVQTGLSDDVNVEIMSGLSERDVIVTGGSTASEPSGPSSTGAGESRSGGQQGGGPPPGMF